MARTSAAALLCLLAACHHAPPDLEARAAPAPVEVRRVPTADEIAGAWRSVAVRGDLAELGHTALYVFGPDGRYTGALAGDSECVGIEGRWTYADGRLDLDDGQLVFDVEMVDGKLRLTSPVAFLELVRAR